MFNQNICFNYKIIKCVMIFWTAHNFRFIFRIVIQLVKEEQVSHTDWGRTNSQSTWSVDLGSGLWSRDGHALIFPDAHQKVKWLPKYCDSGHFFLRMDKTMRDEQLWYFGHSELKTEPGWPMCGPKNCHFWQRFICG